MRHSNESIAARWVLFLIALAFFIIILPATCSLLFPAPRKMPEIDKVEHRRLLTKHGLRWEIAVIEHGWDGKSYFYRDGRRMQFK